MSSSRDDGYRRRGKERDGQRCPLNGESSSVRSSEYGNPQFLSSVQSSDHAPAKAVIAESRKHEQWRRVVSDKGLVEEYENGGNLGHVSGVELKNTDDDDDEEEEDALLMLQSRSEEPELSEEQLRINDQAQEDELLAMESIYGDSVFVLDRKNGLRCFEIHIDVETKEVSVSVKLNPSANVLETEDDLSDLSYSFKVEYLPPIILTCLLPHSYPSHHPPYFTISTQWLHSTKISSLCGILDSIWKQQSGQEIIYHWVEWLHTSCLSFLGFAQEITLGPYSGMHERDSRAISRSFSAEVDIQLIRSYNDEQLREKFSTDFHECCICFSEFPGTGFTRLPCQHFFCWACMKTYSGIHMKEGTVHKLLCPNATCGGMIPPGLLRRLLSNDDFERWESMMLQKTLESMSDVTYCPRCETICIEDEDNHAQCSKCFFSFCTLCRERRHVGGACTNLESKLLILQERQNSSRSRNEVEKQRQQEMINELLSRREIYLSTKQCPSCNMAISRTGGCNKMVCGNCGSYFCYRCSKRIEGYDHFRGGSCKLYPEEEIERVGTEERRNVRQVAAQTQARIDPRNVHPCPTCGEPNAKVGSNNYIFCWGCQSHYCYSCKRSVRRISRHYGRKGGCQLNTKD